MLLKIELKTEELKLKFVYFVNKLHYEKLIICVTQFFWNSSYPLENKFDVISNDFCPKEK